MKTCTKCKESKSVESFYPAKGYRYGVSSRCKVCVIAYQKIYTKENNVRKNKLRRASRARNKIYRSLTSEEKKIVDCERLSARRAKTRRPAKPSAEAVAHKNQYYFDNKIKSMSQKKLFRAVAAGKVEKKPCEKCGSVRFVDGHHDDYSKPLDVRWLCRIHHQEWHRLNGRGING